MYLTGEEFTNEFLDGSCGPTSSTGFRRRVRDLDLLVIDDVHFLGGKKATQEEFLHTFNTLHNANKQVVITSDVPPKLLSGFEARMRSRLRWVCSPTCSPRPRDPDRDPAQEGHPGAPVGARRRARVHRLADLDQHPRASRAP